MATVASGVSLSFGLLTCTVSMSSAVEPKVSNTNVCTGTDAHGEHAVAKVGSRNTCPECGDIAYTDIKKARKVGDGYVLLTEEDLAAVAGDPAAAERSKKTAALTAHPAENVDLRTTTGEKLYYLTPATGSEDSYATLFALVRSHPELVFLAQWTPRSKTGTFALKAFQGTLCFQERERAESIRQAPAVPTEAPPALLAMAEQVLALPGLVVEYDPATYADSYEQKIAEIVAAKTPTSLIVPDAPAGAPAVQGNAMDALQAMLAAAAPPAKPKRAPRKAAARKTA